MAPAEFKPQHAGARVARFFCLHPTAESSNRVFSLFSSPATSNLSDRCFQGSPLYMWGASVCKNPNNLKKCSPFCEVLKLLYIIYCIFKAKCWPTILKDDCILWIVEVWAWDVAKFHWTEKAEIVACGSFKVIWVALTLPSLSHLEFDFKIVLQSISFVVVPTSLQPLRRSLIEIDKNKYRSQE